MEFILSVLADIISLSNILIIVAGVALGMIIGCIPGLTVTMGIIIMLPLTYGFSSPTTAIVALLAVYVGGMYGGSISAILLNTPGTNSAIATTFDGYPLAKQGKSKLALDVSLYSSFVGGLISSIILIASAGLISNLVSGFSSSEFFALGILGIAMISGVSGDNIIKGIIGAMFGIFISTMGLDPVSGVSRFSFSSMLFYDGISIMPAMIALIALIQITFQSGSYINNLLKGNHVKAYEIDNVSMTSQERRSLRTAIIKSSIISTLIGIMPGVGAEVAQFVSYNSVRNGSKTPEKFGKGAIEGISAAECSNNTVISAAMIPLLTMGIPGDGVTALLLGAFILHGVIPGPTMFTKHATTAYGIMVGIIIANIFLFIIGKLFTRAFAKIVQVRYSYLAVLIMAFCFAGAYAANGSSYEIILMLGLFIIAYFLNKFEVSVIPIMLGMILGPIIESNFINSMIIYDGDFLIFFKRPISLIILILTVIMTYSVIRVNKKVAQINQTAAESDQETAAE